METTGDVVSQRIEVTTRMREATDCENEISRLDKISAARTPKTFRHYFELLAVDVCCNHLAVFGRLL